MKLPEAKDYPKTLMVLNEWYKIRVCKRVKVCGELVYGACDPTKKEIRIMQAEPIVMFQTLLHEILHALAFEYDFELNHRVIGDLEKSIANLLLHNF